MKKHLYLLHFFYLALATSGYGQSAINGIATNTTRISHFINPASYLPAGVSLAASTIAQRDTAFAQALRAGVANKTEVRFSDAWKVHQNILVITGKLVLRGIGRNAELQTDDNTGVLLTIQTSTPGTATVFNWDNYLPVQLENFSVRFTGGGTPSSASRGIYYNDLTFANFKSRIENLYVSGFYAGIEMHNSSNYQVVRNVFNGNQKYGVLNTNNISEDFGDIHIDHNEFYGGTSALNNSSAIKIEGGAGFYISYNKMYGGPASNIYNGIWVNLSSSTETYATAVASILRISNNQIEFPTGYAIILDSDFGKGGANTAFAGNRIVNTQIYDNSIDNVKFLNLAAVTGAYVDVMVSSNAINGGGVGSGATINGPGVTRLVWTNNTMNNKIYSGGTGSMQTKPVIITNGLPSEYQAFGNWYNGWSAASDLPDVLSMAPSTTSAADYLEVSNPVVSPVGVTLSAKGALTNSAIYYNTKGASSHTFQIGGSIKGFIGAYGINQTNSTKATVMYARQQNYSIDSNTDAVVFGANTFWDIVGLSRSRENTSFGGGMNYFNVSNSNATNYFKTSLFNVSGTEVEADRITLGSGGAGVTRGMTGTLIIGSATATAVGRLSVLEATKGLAVTRWESTATTNNILSTLYQNKVTTTDATVTTLHTFATASDVQYTLRVTVTAKRTGGASGTAGDGASYIIAVRVKNVGGTLTVGTPVSLLTGEDQAGWDVTFTASSTNVLIQVTGAVSNNISWTMNALEANEGNN